MTDASFAVAVAAATVVHDFEVACYECNFVCAKSLHDENPSFHIHFIDCVNSRLFLNVFDIRKYHDDMNNIYFFPLLKWIYSLNPAAIDLSMANDYIFFNACFYGSLSISQWLLSVKPDIDFSSTDHYAFRSACHNGHTHVARWLLSLNADIFVFSKDEFEARFAWQKHSTDIVELFTKKSPYWYDMKSPYWNDIKKLDGLKSIVKTFAKEQRLRSRWTTRKTAVWMRKNEGFLTKTKTNVFYQVPEDVSRYIIQTFL